MTLETRQQLLVPENTFHTSRLRRSGVDGYYALLASTEWHGAPDVEHGGIDALVEAYPDFREEIHAFARQDGSSHTSRRP